MAHTLPEGVNVALGSDSGNYSDFLDVGRQMNLVSVVRHGLSARVDYEHELCKVKQDAYDLYRRLGWLESHCAWLIIG